MPPASSEGTPLAPAPGSTASLRAANQRRVVALLQRTPGRLLSQAEIARGTRLAPATVYNIVRDLVAAGMLEASTGGGRRGGAVRIARGAGLVSGIDFGHRHVQVAVGDLAGEILAVDRIAVDPDHSWDDGLHIAAQLLDRLLATLGTDRSRVVNVGLGLPAPLTDDGTVMSATILPGWVGIRASVEAARLLEVPVHVDNDANLGALAEHQRGAGRGHDNMVFVKVSSGLGAGLILNGELFRGAHGTAGELGHLTFDEQGPFCRCGSRGCLEAYASLDSASSALAGQVPGSGVDGMVEAARTGNVAALRMFEDVGLHLGWGLAMLTNLMDPSAIVVGGDMARAGEMLLHSVRVGLRRHALGRAATHTDVVVAELGDRASVIGALLLALHRTDLVAPAGTA